jgi:hypothetical protein
VVEPLTEMVGAAGEGSVFTVTVDDEAEQFGPSNAVTQ